jgi:hypothetical protein
MTHSKRMTFGERCARVAACALGTAVLALPISAVHAEDGKVYSAIGCQQSGVGAEPYRHAGGAYNYTANLGFVFCPIVKDEVGSTNGLNSAYVFFYKPATSEAFACTLYSRNQYATAGYTQYRYDTNATAGYRYLYFTPISSYSSGHYLLGCWLPSNSGVISYQTNEWS